MSGLRIAPGCTLPIDAVTETFGILANRGRGKSYATHVLVEEIHDAGVPVVILDIKGDWWGVRSSADGTSEGMPFYIFGGDHSDLPLEPTSGELLADLVVDERVSVVLDLSLLSKTKARSFATAFAERLYHRNREPLFLVVDEADVLIPQRQSADTARLIGAYEDIAKRGRGRGIGIAVVTQRPQEVAKSVLDLMETLLLMGMTGRLALKSVGEWTNIHVDDDDPAAVMRELPRMQVGEAWVWSPLHGILQRASIRQLRTFDSHPTPKVGETRKIPKTRAVLDLAALGDRIAETIEKVKADDPKALRARVRDLEQRLAKAEAVTPEPVVETVEVPVLDPTAAERLYELLDPLGSQLSWLSGALLMLKQPDSPARPGAPRTQTSLPSRPTATAGQPRPARTSAAGGTTARAATHPAEQGTTTTDGADVRLGKTERTILAVLAEHGPRTHGQLALLSGYSPKASTIGVSLGKLRKAGYVADGQPITATQEGVDWLGDYEPLPTGRALIDYWRNKFGLTEQRVLDAVLSCYPATTSQAEVAELTGYSPTASTIGVALGRLRKVGVIDGWRVSDDFAAGAGLS